MHLVGHPQPPLFMRPEMVPASFVLVDGTLPQILGKSCATGLPSRGHPRQMTGTRCLPRGHCHARLCSIRGRGLEGCVVVGTRRGASRLLPRSDSSRRKQRPSRRVSTGDHSTSRASGPGFLTAGFQGRCAGNRSSSCRYSSRARGWFRCRARLAMAWCWPCRRVFLRPDGARWSPSPSRSCWRFRSGSARRPSCRRWRASGVSVMRAPPR